MSAVQTNKVKLITSILVFEFAAQGAARLGKQHRQQIKSMK